MPIKHNDTWICDICRCSERETEFFKMICDGWFIREIEFTKGLSTYTHSVVYCKDCKIKLAYLFVKECNNYAK